MVDMCHRRACAIHYQRLQTDKMFRLDLYDNALGRSGKMIHRMMWLVPILAASHPPQEESHCRNKKGRGWFAVKFLHAGWIYHVEGIRKCFDVQKEIATIVYVWKASLFEQILIHSIYILTYLRSLLWTKLAASQTLWHDRYVPRRFTATVSVSSKIPKFPKSDTSLVTKWAESVSFTVWFTLNVTKMTKGGERR